jgi:hypothetical protein
LEECLPLLLSKIYFLPSFFFTFAVLIHFSFNVEAVYESENHENVLFQLKNGSVRSNATHRKVKKSCFQISKRDSSGLLIPIKEVVIPFDNEDHRIEFSEKLQIQYPEGSHIELIISASVFDQLGNHWQTGPHQSVFLNPP